MMCGLSNKHCLCFFFSTNKERCIFMLLGQMVKIAVPGDEQPPSMDDDIHNYSLSFVRAAMDFLQLDDLIKAGDIDRLTLIMKRLIPTFIGLTSYTCRSKYAIECVNFCNKD